MKESKLIKFLKTKEFLIVLCSFLCTLTVWGGVCIAKSIQNKRLQQQNISASVGEDSDSEESSDRKGNKTPVLKVKTKTASLLVKETATISVTVEGTEDKPTFTSSDNKIATVNEDGVVQGVSAGKAEITIELGSLSGVCKVTVEDSARVTALINALPKADNLTGLSGVAITEARVAYDALSDRAKASVKNYKTLTNLESAYAKEYRMLYSMTDIASFTKNSNYPGYKNVSLASGKDATYGKILTATYANNVLGDNHVIVNYKKAENIEWLLEGYGIVTFYVYNSRPDDARLICNFGGKMKTNYITLNAGTWTKVEVPSEDFMSGSYFGIYSVGYKKEAQQFKFSPIWAERGPSPEELAQVVIDLINALPTKDKLNALSGSAIEEARNAYDALKEEARALVKNYATLTELESAYHVEYKMIYGMSNIAAFTKNANYPGANLFTLKAGTDTTYGKTLNATFATEKKGDYHVVINYKKPENLAEQLDGYRQVCFYVYNDRAEDARLMSNFGGKMNTKYAILAAKEWTKVEVPTDDFISGSYFGIYSVGYKTETQEFKFSAIWAERGASPEELAQTVIDLINALPAKDKLNALSGSAIEEARNAYDALDEEVKAQVSNYATLTALESAYQENYKMLYGMSDISAFTKNTSYPGTQYFTLTSGTDTTYGKVLNATYANESTGDNHIVIKYAKPDDIETQLNGYEKVCFYVYNGRSDTRRLVCNFGGSLNTKYAYLEPGAWTKIEMPVADFISGSYFGIYDVGYQTGTQEFKFSAIWAEKGPSSEDLAQAVIDMIAILPEIDQLNALSGSAIVEARLAYDALDEEAKAKVSNYATLTALESAYNENYKMLYSMLDTTAFSIHTSYQYTGITLNATPGVDETYGNVLTATRTDATGTRHLVIKYAQPTDLETQLSGYEKVCFYVYNGHSSTKRVICNFGGSQNTKYAYLEPEAWTKVEVPVADFISGSYFGVYDIGGGTGTQEFKFSAIWAEKDNSAAEAQPVIDMIDALPTVAELQGYHEAKITEVRTAYDALSDAAKAKVSNYATLTALESSYSENYKMLYGMSDISALTNHTNYPGYQYFVLSAGTDTTYGNVLNAAYANDSTGTNHVAIKYAKPDELENQLSGYEKVCFYVYNGHSVQKRLMSNFGGSLNTKYAYLEPGAWTKIEVPVADFISGTYFGIYDVGTGTHEFKFSAIWAEKDNSAAEAQPVIDMIDALPAVAELTGYHQADIVDARAAYDALSEGAKVKVSNYAALTALENAYSESYKMLYGMSDISVFTKNSSYPGYQYFALSAGTDTTYGNVLNATYACEATGDGHVVIKYAKPADLETQLSGYEKVCFYVYNGRSDTKRLMCNFGGSLNTKYAYLEPGAWTKIEVPVADFISGTYFGIYDVGYKTGTQEFKFSAIWAEKDNLAAVAQPVIDMIDALPKVAELQGYHQTKIMEARAAYDTLSDGTKAKVSNYATLTALESTYNGKYKMLYDMSDISAFTNHTNYPGYQYFALSAGTDTTYGNVLNASYANDSTGTNHVAIKYAKPDELENQLSGYEKVCFYVYNGHSAQKRLMSNFGGSLNTKYAYLEPGAWTKIEVPVADFISGTYFGIYNVGTGTHEFKFSPIWAEKGNSKVLYDMSDISVFTKNSNYPGYQYFALSAGTDTTYGNVLNATYASEATGDGHIIINYAKPTDLAEQLSGYEKVCFHVYNGRSDEKRLICNFGGSTNNRYAYLEPGAWTKIEVPVADFISGTYFGIYDVGYQTGTQEFKFSAIRAE